MEHSTYSASASHRWIACPGSIPLTTAGTEQGLLPEESPSSPAAEEGTLLHDWTEWCLKNDKESSDCKELSTEQKDAVQYCLEKTRAIAGSIRIYEMRSMYGNQIGLPNDLAFGTADVVILDGTTLHVADHKFGRYYVEADKNPQLELYALGAVDALESIGEEVKEVFMHIFQPRVNSEQEPYRLTRKQLAKTAAKFKKAAKLSMKEAEKNLHLSEQACKFCPAKTICPKMKNTAKEVAASAAEIEEFTAMLDDDLVHFMELADTVRGFFNDIEKEANRRLAIGEKVKGYKLVQGRAGNRRWDGDDEEIKKFLKTKGINPTEEKVITPAQAESQLAKTIEGETVKVRRALAAELINKKVIRAEGKPTMVPESASGTPWSKAASMEEFN